LTRDLLFALLFAKKAKFCENAAKPPLRAAYSQSAGGAGGLKIPKSPRVGERGRWQNPSRQVQVAGKRPSVRYASTPLLQY